MAQKGITKDGSKVVLISNKGKKIYFEIVKNIHPRCKCLEHNKLLTIEVFNKKYDLYKYVDTYKSSCVGVAVIVNSRKQIIERGNDDEKTR